MLLKLNDFLNPPYSFFYSDLFVKDAELKF